MEFNSCKLPNQSNKPVIFPLNRILMVWNEFYCLFSMSVTEENPLFCWHSATMESHCGPDELQHQTVSIILAPTPATHTWSPASCSPTMRCSSESTRSGMWTLPPRTPDLWYNHPEQLISVQQSPYSVFWRMLHLAFKEHSCSTILVGA